MSAAPSGAAGQMGGNAFGGAIFANTTTATSLSSTAGNVVRDCAANGGTRRQRPARAQGGAGGSASGGGLFVNGGSSAAKATLAGFTFEIDKAMAGHGGDGDGKATFGPAGGDGGSTTAAAWRPVAGRSPTVALSM